MKKIKLIRNAITVTSDLTVDEIKLLEKQNPMALALEEPNSTGGMDIIYNITYGEYAYGCVNDNSAVFVSADENNCAYLTLLIPANVKDVEAYLFEQYAQSINYIKVIEKKAKQALENLYTSKDEFAKEFVDLEAENQVYDVLLDIDNCTETSEEEEVEVKETNLKKGDK